MILSIIIQIKGLPDLKEFAKEFNKNYVFELDEKDFVPMVL